MNALIRNRGLKAVYANRRGDNRTAIEILGDLQSAFDGFRSDRDTELHAIKAELDRINGQVAAVRIGGGGGDGVGTDFVSPSALLDARAALSGFMRTGVPAAMSTDSSPDGGYLVDRVLSDQVQRRRLNMSPLGRLARRETITTGDRFEEPFDYDDIEATWVGERETRTNTQTAPIALLSYPVHEIYSQQPVTQRLLDDSQFDVGGWLEGKLVDKFARSENAAFVSGDGVKKPLGILSYDTVDNASWTWGKIGFVKSGGAADFASEDPGDALIDLVMSLRAPYRANARWLMNSATAGKVRKMKDDQDRYLWVDSLAAGIPPQLLGYPVELDEEMSVVGANAFPIAFGDFNRAYVVVEKPGIRLLRDPYTSKPNVLFYAYRRVGGGVSDFDAMKLLKIST